MTERERILVVVDEEASQEMVSKILNEKGYETVSAKNEKEALEILRNTSPTIMIADIGMPEMEGLELIRSVKAEFPDTHILCMTVPGASNIHTHLDALGAVDYIIKPFTVEEMRAKLSRVIRERDLVRNLTHQSLELERANEEL
jgi:DNA-binding response OmpR family regulator